MKKITTILLLFITLGVFPQQMTLDESFMPTSVPTGNVNDFVVQPDGKIVIVGNFQSFGSVSSSCIARLNSDGTLDDTFNVALGATNNNGYVPGIFTVNLYEDGKIFIGGTFSHYDGVYKNGMARLNVDGSLDNSFNADNYSPSFGNGVILSSIITPNQKLYIGGYYSLEFSGGPLKRLNYDGSDDDSFVLSGGSGGNRVECMALQSDGRLIIGGNGPLQRINFDGSLDFINDFNDIGIVRTILVDDNDKILVGGIFSGSLQVGSNLVCLNSDGTLDESFNTLVSEYPNFADILTIIKYEDKYIVGGEFLNFDPLESVNIMSINNNGTIDNSIDFGLGFTSPSNNSYVNKLFLLPSNQLLAAGNFWSFNGATKHRFARLNGLTLGSEQFDNHDYLKVYNISNGIRFDSDKTNIKSISIYDTLGRALFNATDVNSNSLTIDSLRSGNVVLSVTTLEDGSVIKNKIII